MNLTQEQFDQIQACTGHAYVYFKLRDYLIDRPFNTVEDHEFVKELIEATEKKNWELTLTEIERIGRNRKEK